MSPAADSPALPGLFRILADSTRLRVLALVSEEELGVGELARLLGLSASRLGNHLRILRESGLVTTRKEGTWSFVRLRRDSQVPADLWKVVETHLPLTPGFAEDRKRLRQVLDERRAKSRAYFDRVAPRWDVIGSDFQSGTARHRVASALLPPDLVVADVGAGTGYLAATLAPWVRRLILVDHAPAMLEKARENLRGSRAELDFRVGEIDALPLEDEEVDAVVAGLVLHHAPDLGAFFREAHRVLKPKGILVVEDLLPHRETWLRDTMADLRLGLFPEELLPRLTRLGFEGPEVQILEDRYTPERPEGGRAELPLFLIRARKEGSPDGMSRRRHA